MCRLTEKNKQFMCTECLNCIEGRKIEDQYNKLQQLEDIEEEMGIDLITLFKALTNGFFAKDVTMYHLTGELSENQKLDPKYLRLNMWYGCIEWENIWNPKDYLHEYYFKDYGKTWALTKEELLDVEE